MDEAFWKDERKIEDMSFGAELQPKLVDVMKEHPWPDSAFIYVPPVFTYERPAEKPDFDFAKDEADRRAKFEAWVSIPANIEAHRVAQFADWKKRMAEIPTDEAQAAWEDKHAVTIERVRNLLRACRVQIAEDIKKLGCTGAVHYGLSPDEVKFLRMGLAGGGVGLPCFVPPTRFCLLHETTGGLQEGQAPGYSNVVESISRELTPEEIVHGKLVTEAQWKGQESEAFQMLRGRKLPEGWQENVEALRKEGGIDDIVAAGKIRVLESYAPPTMHLDAWTCPDHRKTNWQCRYCVAQAVVEGDIEPVYRLAVHEEAQGAAAVTTECPANKLAAEIIDEDAQGVHSLDVYVRVATFTRKLSRD